MKIMYETPQMLLVECTEEDIVTTSVESNGLTVGTPDNPGTITDWGSIW